MKHIVRATITLLLGLATLGPAYAQKSKLGKLGTAVQSSARAAKRATNPAFQEALSHAKALREIQLNRAVLNAAHTPPVQTLPTVPPAVLEPKPAPVPPTVTPAAPTQPETFGKRPRAAYQRPQYW